MATAPIKSRERALEKIVNDYGGDASRIKDLARNTIIVPSDQIDSVVSALAHNGAAVKRIDAATDPLGYSGVNSSLKTKNGITGEIQVNSPEMIYAKETPKNARAILGDDVYDSISAKTGIEGGLGHKFYEQWRALPEGHQGRLPIEAQSKAYYDATRSKAGQSATNSAVDGSLARRMERIAARTPEDIADRSRVAALIQKARIQGDPGVPQLISKLEKNGVQVKDTNHLIGNPLREVDIETTTGIIVQVKKLSSANKIIDQVEATQLRTGQKTVGYVVEQHRKANSIVQNAGKHVQVTNKLDTLLNWLHGE